MSDVWNARLGTAAQLVAAGLATDQEIGRRLNVSRKTLYNWKNRPEFAGRVEAILSELRTHVHKQGVAIAESRVKALNDRWTALRRIIEARAADQSMEGVPGGTTGLLVKRYRAGATDGRAAAADYVIDAVLLRELGAIEREAAVEAAVWVAIQGPVQITKAYRAVSPEDI